MAGSQTANTTNDPAVLPAAALAAAALPAAAVAAAAAAADKCGFTA